MHLASSVHLTQEVSYFVLSLSHWWQDTNVFCTFLRDTVTKPSMSSSVESWTVEVEGPTTSGTLEGRKEGPTVCHSPICGGEDSTISHPPVGGGEGSVASHSRTGGEEDSPLSPTPLRGDGGIYNLLSLIFWWSQQTRTGVLHVTVRSTLITRHDIRGGIHSICMTVNFCMQNYV